jgi:hypothetical protein
MEQSTIVETFETSLGVNLRVEINNIVVFFMVVIIAIYFQISLIMFFELLVGSFLFAGTVLMGFVGIAAHVKYYFNFERNRKVDLYTDRMVISMNGEVAEQIFKNDIVKIILYDKINSSGVNFHPTNADPFYYLVVIANNQEMVVLTCLLGKRLKKKIASWYGQELEHKYQFFPFPPKAARIGEAGK